MTDSPLDILVSNILDPNAPVIVRFFDRAMILLISYCLTGILLQGLIG